MALARRGPVVLAALLALGAAGVAAVVLWPRGEPSGDTPHGGPNGGGSRERGGGSDRVGGPHLEGSGHVHGPLDDLKEALSNGERGERSDALQQLARLLASGASEEEVARALLLALVDGDAALRAEARQALLQLGASAVPVLLRAGLTSDDVELPLLAAELLGELAALGQGDAAAIEAELARRLSDTSERRSLRERAALALAKLPRISAAGLDALALATKDRSDEVARCALEALGKSPGGAGGDTLLVLLGALTPERSGDVHGEALTALRAIRAPPERVLEAVVALAEKGKAWSGMFHPYAKEVVPYIPRLLENETRSVRRLAFEVVHWLEGAAAGLEAVLVQTGTRDAELRGEILGCLCAIDTDLSRYVPTLESWVAPEHSARQLRENVYGVFTRVVPEGHAALRRALVSPERGLRAQVVNIVSMDLLHADSRDAAWVRPALERLAREDPDPRLRRMVAWSLQLPGAERPSRAEYEAEYEAEVAGR